LAAKGKPQHGQRSRMLGLLMLEKRGPVEDDARGAGLSFVAEPVDDEGVAFCGMNAGRL